MKGPKKVAEWQRTKFNRLCEKDNYKGGCSNQNMTKTSQVVAQRTAIT